MSLSTKARHVHRILPHPESEPNSFGGFESATTLLRWTGQVASALHESMWQYHKYRSLYVRPELRCNEQRRRVVTGVHFSLYPLSSFHFSRSRVSISNRTTRSKSLLRSCDRRILRARGARLPATGLPSRACNRVGAQPTAGLPPRDTSYEARKGGTEEAGRCSMDMLRGEYVYTETLSWFTAARGNAAKVKRDRLTNKWDRRVKPWPEMNTRFQTRLWTRVFRASCNIIYKSVLDEFW